jgi:iron complex transport system ATP-binding protein
VTLLEARGLSIVRGPTVVLREVDLALEPRETLALVGPNAAGKSTLLRALTGLLPPSSGEVVLRGRPLRSWNRLALARSVSLVTAEDEGPDALRVVDRVSLGRYPHLGPFRSPGGRDRDAVERALEVAGISHLASRTLGTLSAGERQLASVARGLAQEAEILLLDEPASHLDIGHELQLFSILDDIASTGVAVLAVVHDLPRAAAWASRMVLLQGGRPTASGTPAEVLLSPECADAFGVRVRSHTPSGFGPLYTFERGNA